MKWTDEIRRLKIRTNADTPEDAKRGKDFGAEGIGLCRTEHMFFGENRIDYVRQMILTAGNVTSLETAVKETESELDNAPKRKLSLLKSKAKKMKAKLKTSQKLYNGALNKLLPMQRSDFEKIFKIMDGFPVTIRLLDPPLHEFLPNEKSLQIELARKMGMTLKEIKDRVNSLHETNPMLGLRGCRLGIIYPDIYRMQVQAIIEAACTVKKNGIKVIPEIMIPLVGTEGEMSVLKKDVETVANRVLAKKGVKINYKIGTMIEIPRAALTADRIARHAEFFSFGTNDLTQMTFGYSRDDVGSFVPQFVKSGILKKDPFQILDQEGVGQLVKTGIKKGRQTRPDLKIGICGEHGGDPSSIEFCHRNAMDYVSCSPFRVPIARLATAQAVIKEKI
jgi:pyruvate,orthophosphate dikinase